MHHAQLERYRDAQLCAAINASSQYIPSIKVSQKHWWRIELDELKQKCIVMSNLCSSVGRPRIVVLLMLKEKCKYAINMP